MLQPGATPPQLVYSHDPDRDGRFVRQHGYVLIGTASFYGAPLGWMADQILSEYISKAAVYAHLAASGQPPP
jgi:hypothetical protein